MTRPISFFVHHHGRGHANRYMAIIRELEPGLPVSVLTADPSLFAGFERDIEIVELPNMIGAPVPTPAFYDQPTPSVMHCVHWAWSRCGKACAVSSTIWMIAASACS